MYVAQAACSTHEERVGPKGRSRPRGVTRARKRWRDTANVVVARPEILLEADAEVRSIPIGFFRRRAHPAGGHHSRALRCFANGHIAMTG